MWHNPLPLSLVPTDDSNSFRIMELGTTGLPIGQHPGAFGVTRKHHTHEGVDLYAHAGTAVFAVEDGEVIAVRQFTGPELGHDWWLTTYGVWVQGATGVVLYGEILPTVNVGDNVLAGDVLGDVTQVLKVNKGRPTSMLHLELREKGNVDDIEWDVGTPQPRGLLDPTIHLLTAVQTNAV